jgi:glycosyl hydrolase family 113
MCVVVGTEADPGYDRGRGAAALDRLRRLGAEWISLGPQGRQAGLTATRIDFPDPGPTRATEDDLVAALRDAKARGFKVLWSPQLWVGTDAWRGDVRMLTEAAWREWFASYRAFLLHEAAVAARERADMLSVGLELLGTVGREHEWRGLIAEVRRVYPGPLTYAANWWREVEAVPFWDALDRIGVQFFYPLATSPAAPQGDLRAGLARIRAGLEALAARTGRPYLFTEVGYRSSPAPWVEPWVWRVSLPEDEADQALCLRLVVDTFRDAPNFAGLFWWNWYLDPARLRPGDRRFSPQGKRAEPLLGAAFGAAR